MATRRAKPKKSDSGIDPERMLSEMDEKFLDCRDIRHPWKRMGLFKRGGYVIRQLACGRCGTTREDTWSYNGDRIGVKYTYPTGYQATGLGSHLDNMMIRREAINRATVYDTEEQLMDSLFRPRRRRAS